MAMWTAEIDRHAEDRSPPDRTAFATAACAVCWLIAGEVLMK
jgi:hypothetical protein